jgi:DNA helicase-2/ATP-dependent DNA helicase PcrA
LRNDLLLASAGAGKTTRIVNDALQSAERGDAVLILTYTRNNQAEIIKKIRALNDEIPRSITVKGWFSFLLEDMIRPYQRCLFNERVENIKFDNSDPHKKNGQTIPGRAEKKDNELNRRHFLVGSKAHTTYISKLACRISNKIRNGRGISATYPPIDRIASIFDVVIIDEVQDMVGWDYEILNLLQSHQGIRVRCVGDFRQTIYRTSIASKRPQTSSQKRQWFKDKSFDCQQLNISWRCVQPICTFADHVHNHQNYDATVSMVKDIPTMFEEHIGVFTVSEANVLTYYRMYKPTILKLDRNTRPDLCFGRPSQNFGESKGQTFDRVLIIPTKNFSKFLDNDPTSLRNGKTEQSLNKLYVAITRARYSVAFLYDNTPTINGIVVWRPE